MTRFLPYWREALEPSLQTGRRPIIAAHGNTLRALVKYLEDISDAKIAELEIPTGIPLVFELDENLKPLTRYYLGKSSAAAHAQVACSSVTTGIAMMIILAPQFTLARFTRSLAGLRLSTDPELPGASPIVLGVSISTYPVTVSLQRNARRRSRFRVARYEDAISQMGAKCDRRQNMRLEPREPQLISDSHF